MKEEGREGGREGGRTSSRRGAIWKLRRLERELKYAREGGREGGRGGREDAKSRSKYTNNKEQQNTF